MEERLQKLMAHAGIASRREAEKMIEQGRVTVNGKRATIGEKADPEKDDIRVDGSRIQIQEKRIYIALYKPMGVVTTVRAQEQEHRRTVRELIALEGHLYPVGRLDVDSEGLILMTNDGELAQKLSHPRYEHSKVYEVTLNGTVPEDVLDTWRRGVVLEDGMTRPVDIRVISREKDHTIVAITMHEGRKRQIRRIANMFGYPVRRLVRTELDKLKLGRLHSGEWRYLSDSEVKLLQESAASTARPRKSVRTGDRKPTSRPRTHRIADSATDAVGQSRPRRERTENGAHSERTPRGRRSDYSERPDRAVRADRDERPRRPRDFERDSSTGSRDERSRQARPTGQSGSWNRDNRPRRPGDFEKPGSETSPEDRARRSRPADQSENRERTERPRRPTNTRPGQRTGRDERGVGAERRSSGSKPSSRTNRPARPSSGSGKPRRSPARPTRSPRRKPE